MRDVRMRGFAERADVETVERRLADLSAPLAAEPVPLEACVGRVLARDVTAGVDVPGFRRAAMDGFAIHGEDSFGASSYDPCELEIVGESLPGRAFDGTVEPGQAVRIMTGAPVPAGADAVAPAEICEARERRVALTEAVAPRRHVGEVGEDISQGSRVLLAGRRLRPQDAGLLASIGVVEVACVRRPDVVVLSTGDELLAPGTVPQGAQIVDSNSVVLRALVERDGGRVLAVERLADRRQEIRAALAEERGDVLLVSGGSSVGQEDHAPTLLAELGRLEFHGVTLRPASPSGGGRIGERLVLLLPGNPVSCLCAYEFFAGPAIRALGGRPRRWPHRRRRARLARKIASELGRTDYVRVTFDGDEVRPLATSGASILSSTVRSDGVVIVERGLEGLAAGSEVEVLLYDEG